jgi:hypothetical protein
LSYQLPHWVWPATLLAVCALAAWRGRAYERMAAGVYFVAWVLTVAVFQSHSEATQWAVLAIDAGVLIFLVWVALRSTRYWPLFAAGFHLLAVVTHLAHAADPRVSGWAYQTAELLWSYLGLYAIGYGAWTAPRKAPSAPAGVPGATRL